MYYIEERDAAKFTKIIHSSQFIENAEPTNESKQKGIYFMIKTKTDYMEAVKDVTNMVKSIYPNRPKSETQVKKDAYHQ